MAAVIVDIAIVTWGNAVIPVHAIFLDLRRSARALEAEGLLSGIDC